MQASKTGLSTEPASTKAKRSPRRGAVKGTPAAVAKASDDDDDERKVGSVDQIVMRILRWVYEGRFVPGQKLIEKDLKDKFGVGRGTIREALRRLEAEGLVNASLHRGARICSFSRDEVRDILEINEHMVSIAAGLAAQRIDRSQDVEPLREIVDAMSRSLGDGDVYKLASLRFDFMRALVRLTKNNQLYRFLPRFDAAIIRTQFRNAGDIEKGPKDVAAFEGIVKYILARDSEKASQAGRDYIRSWARSIQDLPDEYFDKD